MRANITRLIPFKVKVVWPDSPKPGTYGSFTGEVALECHKSDKIQHEHLFNKVWTVVAERSGEFLLAREGELTQWVKSDYCKVVEL